MAKCGKPWKLQQLFESVIKKSYQKVFKSSYKMQLLVKDVTIIACF